MNHINLSSLKSSFAPGGSGHDESHSLLSLSKRLLISRATLRTMLQRGELKPRRVTAVGQGSLYLFSGPYLDSVRESVVEEIVNEVTARLRGLNVGEAQIALAAMHSLRDQSQRIEFASKRPEEDEDEDQDNQPGKTAGDIAGAGIGGAIGSKGGITGAVLGGIVGAASGHLIGKGIDRLTAKAKDKGAVSNAIAGGAIGASGAYIAHKAIQARGGYPRDSWLYVTRYGYEKQWKTNATNLEEQGAYNWMAEQLSEISPKRIFDIGCGEGNGLVALVRAFKPDSLLSVDENPECIRAAEERLVSEGIEVRTTLRGLDTPVGEHSHRLDFVPGRLLNLPGVNLIESDPLIDPELDAFLLKCEKFDAVTVWLMGSHLSRFAGCENLQELKIESAAEYRRVMHKASYRFAARFLKSGGRLQIVDRIGSLEADAVEGLLTMHREYAAEAGEMEVVSYAHRDYVEAASSKAITLASRVQGTKPSALISVIAELRPEKESVAESAAQNG
jgi:SAM-dependent methyltransferase